MKKQGQNLVEYILIFAMVATICYFGFAGKFNVTAIKNLIFNRSTDNAGKIKIEAMTQ